MFTKGENMPNFVRITFYLATFLFFFNVAESAEDAPTIRFELPINWNTSSHYELEVTIPSGFNSLQGFDDWDKAILIEFVPEGEDGENWKEIITINKFIGKNIEAGIFVDLLQKQLTPTVENVKVLEKTKEKFPGYEKATLFLSYDYQNKHEILGLQYFSGPNDCIGVQYTIRSKNDQQAMAKITSFFETATHVKEQAPAAE